VIINVGVIIVHQLVSSYFAQLIKIFKNWQIYSEQNATEMCQISPGILKAWAIR